VGANIYTVGVDGRKLRFAFPIRDDYIGGLVDDKGSIVSADRFLPLCRVDDCCQ